MTFHRSSRAEECEHDWYESSCQAATLSRDGVVTYECLNCEATKTEPIARPQTFKLAKKSYTYNNNWKEPAVKVWDSEGNRISSEYYWVSYEDNYEVGTAKAYVTFSDHYSGTKKLTFTITPRGTSIKKLLPQPSRLSQRRRRTGNRIAIIWRERTRISG